MGTSVSSSDSSGSKKPSLRAKLSRCYSGWPGHESEAFAVLDEICKGKIPTRFFFDFKDLPSRAYEAEQLDRAIDAAEQLLVLSNQDWNNQVDVEHQAHTILGRVALRRGDREKACFYLEKSIEDTELIFRPNLRLVEDLVDAGEDESVLEFLCRLELKLGFDNESLFEVRFRMNTGLLHEASNFEVDEQFYKAYHAYKLSWFKTHRQEKEKLAQAAKRARLQCEMYKTVANEYELNREGVTLHTQNTALIYEDFATELDALIDGTHTGSS